MTRIPPRLGGSLLFALIWAVLAAVRPTTTFHLAPLLVAVWPTLGVDEPEEGVHAAAIGFGIAIFTTILLSVFGLLEGPSLLPWGGPALESLVASGTGALIGVTQAWLRLRGQT